MSVDLADNGQVAVDFIRHEPPALVLLDLMLPGLNGVAVCRSVRPFYQGPIIMLTARIDEIDRLMGLDSGADDYVCKPFSPREVMARVKAQLRRVQGRVATAPDPWSIDEERLRIAWQGHWLDLTGRNSDCFACCWASRAARYQGGGCSTACTATTATAVTTKSTATSRPCSRRSDRSIQVCRHQPGLWRGLPIRSPSPPGEGTRVKIDGSYLTPACGQRYDATTGAARFGKIGSSTLGPHPSLRHVEHQHPYPL